MRWVAFLAVTCLAGSGCISVAGLSAAPGPALHEALLWGSLYPELVVEVGAVPGREPDRAALVALGRTLVELTGRDEGNVSVLVPVAVPAQGGDYRPSDLLRIHGRTAAYIEPGQVAVGRTATLHVLFLDGGMRHDERQRMVLGTTVASAGLIVVFPDAYAAAVRQTPNGQTLSARAEMDRHVLLHELGHALGLVGQRIPMVRPHADPDNPGHSSNPLSILHHQPPMTLAGMVYGDGPRDFDRDDRADLAAFRAQAPRPVLAPASF